eukprot:scaffold433_cov257-Pinguiococcus_pyrenoidosus.AAC.20
MDSSASISSCCLLRSSIPRLAPIQARRCTGQRAQTERGHLSYGAKSTPSLRILDLCWLRTFREHASTALSPSAAIRRDVLRQAEVPLPNFLLINVIFYLYMIWQYKYIR